MISAASSNNSALVASVYPLIPAWRMDRVFDYLVPEDLAPALAVGSLVRVKFGARKVRAVVARIAETRPERDLETIAAIVVSRPVAPEPLDRLMEWVAHRYAVPAGSALQRVVPPRVRIAVQEAKAVTGGPAPEEIAAYEGGPALVESIETGKSGVWSLRLLPSTDRGRLIAELVAAAGRSGAGASLIAVPEVRYGSAVLDRLHDVWPDLARVDSSRSDAERAESWLKLAQGHGVGGGGRATVFAPAPELRLLIIDEAHHPTYKEDRAPRYDARRVAIERARLQDAVCILLSTTPSLDLTGGSIPVNFVAPPRAAVRAARPIIELIDHPADRVLSHELHARVRDTLRSGGRCALLVPAPGFARAMWCAACKRSLRCERCEAGMAYERGASRIACPRCGLTAPAPAACPRCGEAAWRFLGAGSERIAEQVAAAFPRARVVRADPGVIGGVDASAADVYVTTWIGTKEMVRPPVDMVGVLDADSLLRKPDWRAAENAYHALAEMAEWAGPASAGGRLLIQTNEPGHHAIQALVRADHEFFATRELAFRKELGYPPFMELVKVTASGPDRTRLLDSVHEVARTNEGRVLGPVVPRGARDSAQLLIKCPDAAAVAESLRVILASVPAGNTLSVDVDPR